MPELKRHILAVGRLTVIHKEDGFKTRASRRKYDAKVYALTLEKGKRGSREDLVLFHDFTHDELLKLDNDSLLRLVKTLRVLRRDMAAHNVSDIVFEVFNTERGVLLDYSLRDQLTGEKRRASPSQHLNPVSHVVPMDCARKEMEAQIKYTWRTASRKQGLSGPASDAGLQMLKTRLEN